MAGTISKKINVINIKYSIIVTLVITVLLTYLEIIGVFKGWDNRIYDTYFRIKSVEQKHQSKITIITIDEVSLDVMMRNGIFWQWPREVYKVVLDYLTAKGAKVIGFDMLFNSPDFDRVESEGIVSDSLFGLAIETSGNVVLGAQLERNYIEIYPFINEKAVKIEGDQVMPITYPYLNQPIPQLSKGACLGIVNFFHDEDGVCRSMPLFYQYNSELLPSFPLICLMEFTGTNQIVYNKSTSCLKIGNYEIPINDQGIYKIYWYGPGGVGNTFKYLSFNGVFASFLNERHGESPLIYEEDIKDHIVLIGATAAGLWDLKTTPLTSIEPYPGVEIYATILENILQGDFLSDLSLTQVALFLFFSIFLAYQIWLYFSVRIAIPLSILILSLVNIGCYYVFIEYLKFLPQMAVNLSIVFGMFSSLAVDYISEGREKKYIKKMFGRYLSPSVVSLLLEDKDKISHKGMEIEATVMFTDLQGFTSISENLEPEEVVIYLNEYFSLISEIVLDHDGLMDKYTGDGLMAIFGAPLYDKDHAKKAVITAMKIAEIGNLNFTTREGSGIQLYTRIGINSGKIIVGNIGSQRRTDFTAIGDNVNLAARLEGVNKVYGTQIMLSESTVSLVNGEITLRELDQIRVKGRSHPITIFTIPDNTALNDDQIKERERLFYSAYTAYKNQNYKEALKLFRDYHKRYPEDNTGKTFEDRCLIILKDPTVIDSEGIFNVTTK